MTIATLILASVAWMLWGRKATQRVAFVARGAGDTWLAFGIGLFALVLSVATILGSGQYSGYAQVLAWSTTFVCLAIVVASMTRRRRLVSEPVFGDGRLLSFTLLAAVPVATFLFGLPAALALLTFVWMSFGSNTSRRRSVVLGMSALVFAGVYYVVETLARLRLPEPFAVTVLERFVSL